MQLAARSWIRNQIGTIHNKLPLSPVSGFWAAAGGDAATATHSYAPDHCMYRPNRDIQSNFQDEYVDSGCFWIDPVANTLKEFNHPGSIWKSYSTYISYYKLISLLALLLLCCSALVILVAVAVGTRQRGTAPPGNQELGHSQHTLPHPVIVKQGGCRHGEFGLFTHNYHLQCVNNRLHVSYVSNKSKV